MRDLVPLVERLSSARIVLVGDIMHDRFIYGSVQRISPEAPIPVLQVNRETDTLGGAGNVLRNLAALEAESCFLTVLGDDGPGHTVTSIIADMKHCEPHLLVERDRITTVKTRYVAGIQQLLRVDAENVASITDGTAEDLVSRAVDALKDAKVLVLSDYGKGVLTDKVLRALIDAARGAGAMVVVDPKGRDYSRYDGATIVTPNRAELAEATGLPVHDADSCVSAAKALLARCGLAAVLVTRSQDGMTLVRRDQEPVHLPTKARDVFDVSGAGDTVVATLAAALASGTPMEEACALANAAAGVVVGKIGTAACSAAELSAALQGEMFAQGESKVLGRQVMLDQVAAWRARGLKVGFTNGCFDLIHPGHVSLLTQAKAACDKLVVGLNTDASVRKLKGETRPLQSEAARALVLASMAAVDAVTLFGEDTPLTLIEAILPDVLVKGADYTVETVVGHEIVQANGGRVMLADLTAGQSTTNIVAKMGRDARP
ncbi:D-glycero-beta-D-manno-heptose-7-phosphate kinase [Lacibacterium aquatile]|uniref:Bifunctional protein HldE n=1 Tax=Lacibacterium aquatile TaxID=1168082 RepID=A0ABW5DXF2_9PROT